MAVNPILKVCLTLMVIYHKIYETSLSYEMTNRVRSYSAKSTPKNQRSE